MAGVINTIKTAFAVLNVTMLANPIILVIAAVAALVAAFIYLWIPIRVSGSYGAPKWKQWIMLEPQAVLWPEQERAQQRTNLRSGGR